ncbi:ArsR/SmtB family transcription factor [Catellatospora vulcania]|uniref:ArsR/SmtB family transcription factor n=1 Tax=Catellatospora vulcania TaxID=1460450 RepID=UPI0012D41CAC|nr:helix-turn-helix domain-containing protein [Catellatospora vulcania]
MQTRIVTGPDPLWEITLSSHLLARRNEDPLLLGWHRAAQQSLRAGTALRGRADLFLGVNWSHGDFPDFLTPRPGEGGVDDGLEAVGSTCPRQLRRDVDLAAAARGTLPAAAQELGEGRPAALRELTTGMREYFEAVVRPQWNWVTASFAADHAARSRAVAAGGLAALLDSLHPSVSFEDGVLRVADYPRDRDLHLSGRGLVLVPSFFKRATRPITLIDDDLPPVLVYQVDRGAGLLAVRHQEALSALVGRTRAAILELCAEGGSTSSIAARLNQSPSTASEHLAVLRQAGLVYSERRRNSVEHRLAPLGMALLEGRPGPAEQ